MGVQMFKWGDIWQEIKSKTITSILNIQILKLYNIKTNKYAKCNMHKNDFLCI